MPQYLSYGVSLAKASSTVRASSLTVSRLTKKARCRVLPGFMAVTGVDAGVFMALMFAFAGLYVQSQFGTTWA